MSIENNSENRNTSAREDMTREIFTMLGEMNGKLTLALERHDRLEKHQEEIDKRLSGLERSRAWLVGVIASIMVFVSWAKEYITEHLIG